MFRKQSLNMPIVPMFAWVVFPYSELSTIELLDPLWYCGLMWMKFKWNMSTAYLHVKSVRHEVVDSHLEKRKDIHLGVAL